LTLHSRIFSSALIRFQINPDENPDDETLTFVVQDQFGANAPHQVIVDGPNTSFFGAISINGQLIDSLGFSGVELDRIQNVEIGGAGAWHVASMWLRSSPGSHKGAQQIPITSLKAVRTASASFFHELFAR
jgi:hypothetical protein